MCRILIFTGMPKPVQLARTVELAKFTGRTIRYRRPRITLLPQRGSNDSDRGGHAA